MAKNSKSYNRAAAVAYAHRWALKRNPRYSNFSDVGGDCANFASQCLYAGGGTMNYRPLFGWYYNSAGDRTPSWSGVKYLYQFLVGNKGVGPQGEEVGLAQLEPGDIIQLAIYLPEFHHTLVVVDTGDRPDPSNILISTHSFDSDNRPLSSYDYKKIRAIHIKGIGVED